MQAALAMAVSSGPYRGINTVSIISYTATSVCHLPCRGAHSSFCTGGQSARAALSQAFCHALVAMHDAPIPAFAGSWHMLVCSLYRHPFSPMPLMSLSWSFWLR